MNREEKSTKLFEPQWHAARIDVAEQRGIEVSLGDRLLIRRNDRRRGLTNGGVVSVSKLDADDTIHTCEGAVINPQFRHFCHGYVVTSHKSQGRTQTSIILAAEEVDAKAAYVACSRGRERCSVFVPDLTHFLKRLPLFGRSHSRFGSGAASPPLQTASVGSTPIQTSRSLGIREGKPPDLDLSLARRDFAVR